MDKRGEWEKQADELRKQFALAGESFSQHVLIHPDHPEAASEKIVLEKLTGGNPDSEIRLDYEHLVTSDARVLNSAVYAKEVGAYGQRDISRGVRYAAVYIKPH
jgi:calcineurin-like phosphoesterase